MYLLIFDSLLVFSLFLVFVLGCSDFIRTFLCNGTGADLYVLLCFISYFHFLVFFFSMKVTIDSLVLAFSFNFIDLNKSIWRIIMLSVNGFLRQFRPDTPKQCPMNSEVREFQNFFDVLARNENICNIFMMFFCKISLFFLYIYLLLFLKFWLDLINNIEIKFGNFENLYSILRWENLENIWTCDY